MAAETVRVQRKLFTVQEYEQMVRAGVLGEDDRLELIRGEIMEMSPIGSAHVAHVNRLTRLLVQRAGDTTQVSVQNPIRLRNSEPQPDVALLRPRPDDYASALAEPDDILLLIEVSDGSVDYDRDVKMPLYAAEGIPEAWLVDLNRGAVEVYRSPSEAGYGEKRTHETGPRLSVQALPDLVLDVNEILA